MLNSIALHNFQAHTNTEIEFSTGVNIVTGISNSGKTSIVRALNLVVNNRPLGCGFINDDSDDVCVIIDISVGNENFCIARTRDRKSSGTYELVSNNSEETFEAFGTNVPLEVSVALNLSDINIQQQLSPYFLVLDTPGQVALYIRKIAKLDEIDDVISILSSDVRECNKDILLLTTQLKSIEKELITLSNVDLHKLSNKIAKAKQVEDIIIEYTCDINKLNDIVIQLELLETNCINLPANINNKILLAESFISKYSVLTDKRDALYTIIKQLGDTINSQINLPNDINNTISLTESIKSEYINNISNRDKLSNIIADIGDCENGINEINEKIIETKKESDVLLERLVNCPYCETKLTKEALCVLIKRN